MKYSRPGGISMVEKPPLHTYDISLEVEAHGGYGGIWRPFYLSYIKHQRFKVNSVIGHPDITNFF